MQAKVDEKFNDDVSMNAVNSLVEMGIAIMSRSLEGFLSAAYGMLLPFSKLNNELADIIVNDIECLMIDVETAMDSLDNANKNVQILMDNYPDHCPVLPLDIWEQVQKR